MASNQGTSDFLFENETYIETVPERFACPICFWPVQRDAHLTVCCGHHFCFQCISKVCEGGKPCPMCKATSLRICPNKERQRDIKQLKVHCVVGRESSDSGCVWEGELGQLAQHAKKEHGVTLDGWLHGAGQASNKSQPSPPIHSRSRPRLNPRPHHSSQTSQPSPHMSPASRPVSRPPVTSGSSAQPRLILTCIGQTHVQVSPQLRNPRQSSSKPTSKPPLNSRQHRRVLPVPQPSSMSTNHSRDTVQTKSCMEQVRVSSRHGPVSNFLCPSPSSVCKAKHTTSAAAVRTPVASAKKVTRCSIPAQALTYDIRPGGHTPEVCQGKRSSRCGSSRQIAPPHGVTYPYPAKQTTKSSHCTPCKSGKNTHPIGPLAHLACGQKVLFRKN